MKSDKRNHLYEATMQTLVQYLRKTGCTLRTKIAGSSEGAVWVRDGYLVNLHLTDMTPDSPICYALFEVFPGINTTKAYYPLVAAYCQEYITPFFGSMQASHEHGDIHFSLELPMVETALSENTLAMVEQRFAEVFRKHRANLEALAHGYLPDALPDCPDTLSESPEDEVRPEIFSAAACIRSYLVESGHNLIAEGRDSAGLPSWQTEIFSRECHFQMDISLSRAGFATVKARYGLKGVIADKAYRRMLATFLTKESAPRKVGYLWIGSEAEGFCVVANLSLLDGTFGEETMDLLESILLSPLLQLRQKIELIAHGILPEDSDEPKRLPSAFRHLRPPFPRPRFNVPDPDDEDDDEDDEDDDLPFPAPPAGLRPSRPAFMDDDKDPRLLTDDDLFDDSPIMDEHGDIVRNMDFAELLASLPQPTPDENDPPSVRPSLAALLDRLARMDRKETDSDAPDEEAVSAPDPDEAS